MLRRYAAFSSTDMPKLELLTVAR